MPAARAAVSLCILLMCAGGRDVVAQDSVEVRGTVRDTVSGNPVPFAVISVAGTNLTALANRRGQYRLALGAGTWAVEARKIGYRMTAIRVAVTAAREVDLFLQPLAYALADIEVIGEVYDPAADIMRQAIARKNDILARIHDYRYDAYVKFLIRDLNRDPDSIESVALITETQTTAYWERPDRYQETITGRRQSSNLDAQNNLVSVGQIVNFNRDRIDLQKYSVVSPTADDALEHYDYHMLDTVTVDDRRVFRLAIEPQSDVQPLFVGMIDVADSTFDVLAIDVGANEAVRFDFFQNLRYRQRLAAFGDGLWMPQDIRFTGEVHIGVPIPGFPEHMSFEHSASLSNFRFDGGEPPQNLSEYMIVVADDADDVDSTDWEARRPAPLSGVERAAYSRIDSIQNVPPSVGTQILSGTLGALFLTGNVDFFRFNRVEGAYLGAGATLRDLSPDWILRARAGRAIGGDEWQFRVGAQHRLVERQRLWVGASVFKEVTQRPALISGARNTTHLALFSKTDPLDYYHQHGVTLTLGTRVFAFTQLQLRYNDVRQRSLPVVSDYSFFERDKPQRPNPPIRDGRLRSITGSFSYDSRPLLKRKGRDFYLNQLVYTRLTLSFEYAEPSLIPNDFDFNRYFVLLQRRQRTLNMGLTSIDAFVGSSWGRLPPQRYFTVDFGNGVFFERGGFNTLSEENFSGNRAASVFVSHDFDQQFFRVTRLPLLRRLPLTFSIHGGAFWTDFVDHTANPGDDRLLAAPTAYTEFGFGLGNLTPMFAPFNFTAWFTWQLSGYDTDRFMFTIGIPGQ